MGAGGCTGWVDWWWSGLHANPPVCKAAYGWGTRRGWSRGLVGGLAEGED